jgi:hypothetical protein
LCFLLVERCSAVVWHRLHGRGELVVEPSLGVPLNTELGNPLAVHSLLVANAGTSLPIALQLDYLYLVHYWPAAVPRLYAVRPSRSDLQYRLYSALREWCHIPCNRVQTFDEFFPTHPDFLLYGLPLDYPFLSDLIAKGAEIRSLRFGHDGLFLAEVHLRRPWASRSAAR